MKNRKKKERDFSCARAAEARGKLNQFSHKEALKRRHY